MPPLAQESDTHRTCGRCHRTKSIRGVWYLVPAASVPFVCESCFAQAGRLQAV